MRGAKPYRVIQTDLLTDPDLDDWSFEELAFYAFLIISPFTQLSGIINVSERILAATFRLTSEQVRLLLETIEQKGKIIREGNVIWIKNFVKYQNVTGDALVRAARELEQLGENSLIYSVAKEMYPEMFERAGRREVNPRLTPGRPPVDQGPTPAEPTGTVTGTGSVTGSVTGTVTGSEIIERNIFECSDEHLLEQSSNPPESERERVPYKQIQELYNSICVDLPRCTELTNMRKKLLKARWKQYPDLAFWQSFFERVQASDFLCGRSAPTNGRPPFVADFTWIIRPENFQKILEGKYDNRNSNWLKRLAEQAMRWAEGG